MVLSKILLKTILILFNEQKRYEKVTYSYYTFILYNTELYHWNTVLH